MHARAGDRAAYRPVVSRLLPEGDADPVRLAAAYRRVVGARRCYAADLDAIAGSPPDVALLRRLAGPGGFDAPLLVDAGIASLDHARVIVDAGHHVVLGLESLPGFGLLERVAALGPTMFSLDLRTGIPVVPAALALDPRTHSVAALARAAAQAGVAGIIVLDLAQVGMRQGPDLDLLALVREEVRNVELIAGGGIRPRDLGGLAHAGVDAALVGTALHEGWLPGAEDQSPASDTV